MLNHTHIPALQQARARIEAGLDAYICFALDRVAREDYDQHRACRQIKAHIAEGLDDRAFVSTWIGDRLFNLNDLHSCPNWAAYGDDWDRETGVFTLARLAWLDRLIEEASTC
jgi:hypothetical protein